MTDNTKCEHLKSHKMNTIHQGLSRCHDCKALFFKDDPKQVYTKIKIKLSNVLIFVGCVVGGVATSILIDWVRYSNP